MLMKSLKNLRASDHLNFIRSFAAVMVLFAHLRSCFFVPYEHIASPTFVVKCLFILSGWGSEAVIIFFVLSGFLVGASGYSQIRNNTYSWQTYLISRFTRLYVVLIPSLALSFLVVYFGDGVFLGASKHPDIGLNALVNNMLFLQTRTSTFAGNLPLWSLSNEFWYYVLFPCLMLFLTTKSMAKKVGYFSLQMLIFLLIGKEKSLYFIIWLMGVGVYLLKPYSLLAHKPRLRTIISTLPLIGLAVVFILSHFYHAHLRLSYDFANAGFFSIFLYLILQNKTLSSNDWYHKFATETSGCSYTLYLVHYPLLLLFMKVLHVECSWPFDVQHIFFSGLIFLIILGFSYCFSQITEAHTDKVRKYITQRVAFFSALGQTRFMP